MNENSIEKKRKMLNLLGLIVPKFKRGGGGGVDDLFKTFSSKKVFSN